MAKPLGPKSILIREAISANPDLGNTELAEMLNGSPDRKQDKIEVKPGDIAAQRQAMKKPGAKPAGKSGGTNSGRKAGKGAGKAGAAPVARTAAVSSGTSPVDLLDQVFALAQQCGGVGSLKRVVDRLAELQGQ